MAKRFYTIEEAAGKLGVGADKVREMVQSGQLQEFRHEGKLVVASGQVDLLAGGKEDDVIQLASDSGEIQLASDESGSNAGGMGGSNTKERSGISIFEEDDGEQADPMAQTQVTSSPVGAGTVADSGGSGSGLLDLTREADDTSLGANLLDDVYGNQEAGAAGGGGGGEGGGGALFESAGVASDVSAAAAGGGLAMVAAEPYDGAGSGLAGGLALGVTLVMGVMISVVVMGIMGVEGAGLGRTLAENLWMYVGAFAGVCVVFGVIGWALGRRG